MNFKVGQKVKALDDFWDDGQDHHPAGYYARKGDTLVIRKINKGGVMPLSVSHENITDNSFGVDYHEVAPLEEAE